MNAVNVRAPPIASNAKLAAVLSLILTAALHSSRRVSVPPGGTLSVTGEYVTSAVRSIGIACSRFS